MEKHFTALLKYAVTKVGDEIETVNGAKVEIMEIKEIEVVDYHHVLIKFTGKPITT